MIDCGFSKHSPAQLDRSSRHDVVEVHAFQNRNRCAVLAQESPAGINVALN